MRFPVYSLRTSVMAHLAFLILSAMLLINIVLIKVAENHLVQTKLQMGRLLLDTLSQSVTYERRCRDKTREELGQDSHFKNKTDRLLRSVNFSGAMVLDEEGRRIFSTGTWGKTEKGALSLARESIATKNLSFNFYGTTWGVIWLAHERVNMSRPILIDERLAGAVTIGAHLGPIYQSLWESERFVLLYILLNTIILVLFGVYLLSRTVVKPIHKLLNITKQFKDVEAVPLFADLLPNEIGQLSRSLNMMLQRLEQNKKELKDYISSLEKANQEIRKAQDDIIKSEKLSSVGRLATGVAHEIGNPIGIVLGYLELLKGDGLTKRERQDFLKRMESEIRRIHQIIRDLLDFSRSSSGAGKEMSLHALLTETLEMLKPQPMMSHVHMKLALEATSDTVQADPNQLKQVFLNIIMNAADAMVEDVHEDDKDAYNVLTVKTRNRGDSIELSFKDTGAGIKEEELVRIFDPFYTTKEPGKGTGLGLSVCYSIIKGMGGKIRAESVPGKGTEIIVSIPLCQDLQAGSHH